MNRRLLLACTALLTLAGCASDPADPADSPRITRTQLRAWEQDHVVIVISRGNRVRLNGASTAPAELPAKLRELGAKHPGRPVILLLQEGGDEQAETFVHKHAVAAGLGPVDRR